MGVRRITLAFIFSALTFAQTSPEIYVVNSNSPEQEWCPGKALSITNSKSLVVGESWTAARPCFAHFNITPPAGIDPLTVSKFTASATIEVMDATLNDELYIYFQSAQFAGGALSRPQKIIVQTRYPTGIQCTGCTVETAGNGTRIFPAFTVPVGMATVVAGNFHPTLDTILSSHQLYIGLDTGIALRRDGTGYWIELSPSTAAAQATVASSQMAVATAQIARAREETLAKLARPITLDQVESLRSEFEELRSRFDQVQADANAMSNSNADLQNLQGALQTVQDRLQFESLKFNPNIDTKSACSDVNEFGISDNKIYHCQNLKWKEIRTK